MNKQQLYTPSNQTSQGGQIIFYSIVAFVIPFFGYVYELLTFYLPLAYFNILITFGAGILLSVVSIYTMRLCKNRNKKNLIIGTSLATLMFFLSSWITYLIIGVNGPFAYFEMAPQISEISVDYGIMNVFHYIFNMGLHTVFGFPIAGWGLILTWILEASILFIVPIGIAYKHVLYPFSERQQRYYKKEQIINHFARVASENVLIENMNNSVLDTINKMANGSNAKGYSKIMLHTLPNESEHYLSISNIFYDSKNRKSKDLILRYYRINTNTLEEIKKKFRTKSVMF